MKNEKDAALLEDAIQRIGNTQKPEFWKPITIEENQVQYVLNPATGKVAFHEAQLAVRNLNVLIERGYPNEPPPTILYAEQNIRKVARRHHLC